MTTIGSSARTAGHSVRSIAKTLSTSVTEVNRAIDRWAGEAITEKVRKPTLSLALSRLDDLQAVFYRRVLDGDVQCGALVTKIIERRCVMLGLHTPRLRRCRSSTLRRRRKPRSTRSSGCSMLCSRFSAVKKGPTAH